MSIGLMDTGIRILAALNSLAMANCLKLKDTERGRNNVSLPQDKGYRNNQGNLSWNCTNVAPIWRQYNHAIGIRIKPVKVLSLTNFAPSVATTHTIN
ncbi:MAG: hypothetical protein G3I11_02430 [Ferrovum sp.]|nr:hypothetical protein [Ferrovum sp.]